MRSARSAAPRRLARSITILAVVGAACLVGIGVSSLRPLGDMDDLDDPTCAAAIEPARVERRREAVRRATRIARSVRGVFAEATRTADALARSMRWHPDLDAEAPPPAVGQDRPSHTARALATDYTPRTRVLRHPAPGDPYVLLLGPERETHLESRMQAARAALRAAVESSTATRAVHVRIDGYGVIGYPSVADVGGVPAEVLSAAPESLDSQATWLDAESGRFLLRPITDVTGEAVGLVAIEFEPAAIGAALAPGGYSPHEGEAILVDRHDRPLAWTPGAAERIGAEDLGLGSALALGDGSALPPSPKGRNLPDDDGAAITTVGTQGWRLLSWSNDDSVAATEASFGAALASLRASEGGFQLGVSLLAACVVLFGGLGLARSVDRRLLRLVRGADAQVHGDPIATITDAGQDELGLLARLLNAGAERRRRLTAELDESDRRHDQLVGHMADGFFVTDSTERIAEANDRFAGFLQRTADGVRGLYVEELLLPESVERYRIESTRLAAHRPTQCELVWRSPDDRHRRTIVSSLPLFGPTGRFTGAYHMLTDITERERAHAETAKARKIRALGEMADGIVHEFNNLLTVILGNVQYLLFEGVLDDTDADALRVVERAALDGTETIRRIREFTKVRTVNTSSESIDLNEVLRSVHQAVEDRLAKRKPEHAIELELLPRARRCANGGADELREALLAIVTNAIEAMPEGGRLVIETFDRGEDTVALRVRDSGVGMDTEQLEKAYDPFFTTKRGGGCAGLGLSIAYGIVRAHSGRLLMRSRPGRGTTVTCVLPAAAELPAPADDPAATDAPPAPRVLLVGPHKARAEALQHALQDLGLYVALVASPETALALLQDAGIFNTLLAEYDLQRTTGWELARLARANRRDLRIILLADPSDALDVSQARNAGIDRILERPVDARDVHGAVMTALASPVRDADSERRRGDTTGPIVIAPVSVSVADDASPNPPTEDLPSPGDV